MADLPPVCVLAGGRGTRLGAEVRDTPKPLVSVAGRPFLLWVLELLAAHGARDVVLCVGYLGDRFAAALADGGELGLRVQIIDDGPRLLGTAGAVRNAAHLLGDRWLVLYGDTYLRVDYRAVATAHVESELPALMTVLRNDDRWDTSNVELGEGVVRAYNKRAPTSNMRWIDYGLGALTPDALAVAPDEDDLAELYRILAERGDLAAFEATERFYEIGTPAARRETELFLASRDD